MTHGCPTIQAILLPAFNDGLKNLSYWKGKPKFSVEIINEYMIDRSMEGYWISNISFGSIDGSLDSLKMNQYLLELQELQTNLMHIRRGNNGRVIRLDFTEEFMDNYSRRFTINFRFWTAELSAYISYNNTTMEIYLMFLENNNNISVRELYPYELIFLTNNQLRIIRNVFYARHGFIFKARDLQEIFERFWSFGQPEPNPNFTEDMLTDIDRANITTIQRLEALAGD